MKELLDSYFKSTEEYIESHKSIVWKKVLGNKFKTNNLVEEIKNFRNNSFSQGIDNARLFSIDEIKKKFYELIDEINHDDALKFLPSKNVGNLKKFFLFKNKYVDYKIIFEIKDLLDLQNHIFKKHTIKIICEIGGGFGSFARMIRSECNAKYILIDLPEINLISGYYLKEHFPEKKFLLYNDIINNELDSELIKDFDFIIIPPWCKLGNVKVDFFLNKTSFMEMDFQTIKNYFEIIHQNISRKGFFLNSNRYYTDRANYPLHFHQYPYDKKWEVILSVNVWKKRRIHQLLTRRTEMDTSSLEQEMQKIKKLEKFHSPRDLPRIIILLIRFFKKILGPLLNKIFLRN